MNGDADSDLSNLRGAFKYWKANGNVLKRFASRIA